MHEPLAMSGTDVAISVENLSKSYLIGHQRTGQESFREMLSRRAKGFVGVLGDIARGRQIVHGGEIEEFWALKGVSFEVKRGEVLGVIGRNGAGKSTLLKILSRITEPTKGRALIRGRVASLLEVGTGFHPELTGRENIYLNGAILGMSRAEIAARFDEIVDFAEIERFLDTPVKRYSSGMYVRLAFSVAAHLEPEILLVDEVLAVGDVAFQRKCLGRMHDVAELGRTVLFVSHNLASVVDLTTRAILIQHGEVTASGASREVVSQYLHMMQAPVGGAVDLSGFRRPHRTAGYIDIVAVRVCGTPLGCATIEFGEGLTIEIDLFVQRSVEEGIVNINILDEQLQPIVTLAAVDSGYSFALSPGLCTIRCNAGVLPLIPGEYHLNVGTGQMGQLSWDVLEALPGFRVDGHKNAAWINWPNRPGVVLFDKCEWRTAGG